MEYQHGGFPASEAYSWTTENLPRLGDILRRLCSGNAQVCRLAYIEYREFGRYFMQDDWIELIDSLDKFRVQNGHPTVEDRLKEICENIMIYDRHELVGECEEFDEPQPLPVKKVEVIKPANKKGVKLESLKNEAVLHGANNAEQLSLF